MSKLLCTFYVHGHMRHTNIILIHFFPQIIAEYEETSTTTHQDKGSKNDQYLSGDEHSTLFEVEVIFHIITYYIAFEY